ncbi:hypothetical protein Y032_0181g863 [Ancylostoma ceylanicum]|uniref:DOMON domain-containing protein n=1 Tax=Ancylostoma ceylanicum TaxID=53326 RepID=A0A016STA9_9BILA|nr:hypothetical protein Y032_0181g863 [Ancylostoma ceylanicum]
MLPLFLAAFLVSSVAAADCTYSGGDVSARWQVSGDKLTVEFINKKIGNNQWTGIGFGPNMENLEVVLVKIEGSKPVLVTGHTSGYDAPTLDKSANVSPQLMNYNSNQLTFRFTRPLGANGARNHKLDECQTWNFVKEGGLEGGAIGVHTSKPVPVKVCPKECKKSIIH